MWCIFPASSLCRAIMWFCKTSPYPSYPWLEATRHKSKYNPPFRHCFQHNDDTRMDSHASHRRHTWLQRLSSRACTRKGCTLLLRCKRSSPWGRLECTLFSRCNRSLQGLVTLELILICYTVGYLTSIRMYWCSISIYFWVVLCFERSVPCMTFLQLTCTGLCLSNLWVFSSSKIM